MPHASFVWMRLAVGFGNHKVTFAIKQLNIIQVLKIMLFYQGGAALWRKRPDFNRIPHRESARLFFSLLSGYREAMATRLTITGTPMGFSSRRIRSL